MYARKLDDASLSGDIVSLEQFFAEIEKILPDEDTASQARLYYSIGTVYSDLAKAKGITLRRISKETIILFQKKCRYYRGRGVFKERICSLCKRFQAHIVY